MRLIAALTSLLLLSQMAFSQTSTLSVPLNSKTLERNAQWNYALDERGQLWLAYYADDQNLYIHYPDGTEYGLGTTARARALSGLALETDGDKASLLWRDKFPEKSLYFLTASKSTETPVPLHIGGKESEALTRLELAKRDDTTYFMWLGEKQTPEKAKIYHLYFRYTEDGGKTLSPVEQVVSGYYPVWLVLDKKIPIFSWTALNKERVMAMRVFDRKEKTFGPVVKVTDAPNISPIFQAFESKGRWFLTWLGLYGDASQMQLEGVYSDDEGKTWTRFVFDKLHGMDVSRVATASDDKGHLLIAVSGAWRADDETARTEVLLIRSDDNGTTWSDPQLVRSKEARLTRAELPSVAFGAKAGEAVMVWEDWRDIRGNIYASRSQDYGQTWEEAVPLNLPGVANLDLGFKVVNALQRHNDQYTVVAQRYTDDTLRKFDLVRFDFTADELSKFGEAAKLKTDTYSEERLRERINAYWQAFESEDYQTVYNMQDPFFRSKQPMKGFMEKTGKIKYHRHEIKESGIVGRLGRAFVEVEASVPEFTFQGKKVSRPNSSYPVKDHWIYIDGDWYREYRLETDDIRYTDY